MRVVIQLRPDADLITAVADPRTRVAPADVAGALPGFDLDHDFEPVAIPRRTDNPNYSMSPEHASVLVRGELGDDPATHRRVSELSVVTGVFADP
ncbi:peptidase S8, partial [Nocardia gipuzkoensis]